MEVWTGPKTTAPTPVSRHVRHTHTQGYTHSQVCLYMTTNLKKLVKRVDKCAFCWSKHQKFAHNASARAVWHPATTLTPGYYVDILFYWHDVNARRSNKGLRSKYQRVKGFLCPKKHLEELQPKTTTDSLKVTRWFRDKPSLVLILFD